MTDVAALRRFNRAYTQRIGVLDESYLGTGRPLGPSRFLFEIGTQTWGVLGLRRRLGLDSGYVSRMLRQLETEGLAVVEPDPNDGRQRTVRLTRAGRREWRRLDERSERLAQRLVAPLSERQREELDAALTTAERLIRAATIEFDTVDPRSPDARWAMDQYFAELDSRFSDGFDATSSYDTDAVALRAPTGAFVVLHSDHETLGCGGVQRFDDTTSEIKRMWIRADWRGTGLGRRLLEHLEGIARAHGRSRVVLDTNGSLTEAISMYGRMGYAPIERYNDNPYAQHWFAKDL
ncbi:MAG: GCN5-related N-acetyltransferase [Ilumatobacteraceae bacterium]|nr:GCN5-related N-acetyltransferase [Ilumatobacteraceae bacterium]